MCSCNNFFFAIADSQVLQLWAEIPIKAGKIDWSEKARDCFGGKHLQLGVSWRLSSESRPYHSPQCSERGNCLMGHLQGSLWRGKRVSLRYGDKSSAQLPSQTSHLLQSLGCYRLSRLHELKPSRVHYNTLEVCVVAALSLPQTHPGEQQPSTSSMILTQAWMVLHKSKQMPSLVFFHLHTATIPNLTSRDFR